MHISIIIFGVLIILFQKKFCFTKFNNSSLNYRLFIYYIAYNFLFITKNIDTPIRSARNNYYVNKRWYFSRPQCFDDVTTSDEHYLTSPQQKNKIGTIKTTNDNSSILFVYRQSKSILSHMIKRINVR